jgi:hypothetical protein
VPIDVGVGLLAPPLLPVLLGVKLLGLSEVAVENCDACPGSLWLNNAEEEGVTITGSLDFEAHVVVLILSPCGASPIPITLEIKGAITFLLLPFTLRCKGGITAGLVKGGSVVVLSVKMAP